MPYVPRAHAADTVCPICAFSQSRTRNGASSCGRRFEYENYGRMICTRAHNHAGPCGWCNYEGAHVHSYIEQGNREPQ